jgi:hypothetical protein
MYNAQIVESVRQKLLNGVFPYELSNEEREEWGKFKDENAFPSAHGKDLTSEQEEQLYQWLITDQISEEN